MRKLAAGIVGVVVIGLIWRFATGLLFMLAVVTLIILIGALSIRLTR